MAESSLEDQKRKLVKSFHSILGGEMFMFPTMLGISNISRLAKFNQAVVAMLFLAMAWAAVSAWLISHRTESAPSIRLLSRLTMTVTISCQALFHFGVGLLTPEEYPVCLWINVSMFTFGVYCIVQWWGSLFPLPKTRTE